MEIRRIKIKSYHVIVKEKFIESGRVFSAGDHYTSYVPISYLTQYEDELSRMPVDVVEATDEPRAYLIITSTGRYGKGRSAYEAARNAKIGCAWISNVSLYKADSRFIYGELGCTPYASITYHDKYDGTAWTLDDMLVAKGKCRIVKDELVIQQTFKEEK